MAVKDVTEETLALRQMKKEMDMVNHPPHYNSGDAKCSCGRAIECIDVTRHMTFNIGNAMKYLWRYQLKEGIISLQKAAWYIQDEIKRLEKDNATNDRPERKEIS